MDVNTATAIQHKRETGHSLIWTFDGEWTCDDCGSNAAAARAAHPTPPQEDTP